jgi:hypothetical protein
MSVSETIDEIVLGLHPDIGGSPNVLLYGPPGTGKTYILQQLKTILNSGAPRVSRSSSPGVLTISNPVPEMITALLNQTNPTVAGIRTWWLSFHQSITYDDFILGLRPVSGRSSGTLELEPRAGPLFEAMEHAKNGGTSFIFIDEINRGNLPQILGDFITFMEYGKRLGKDGNPIAGTLSFTPAHLNVENTTSALSEDIRFRDNPTAIPIQLTSTEFGYEVPHHLYIIATMNSLDRSVAPIDSAIERRFNRIALKARPDGDFTGYTSPGNSWGVFPASKPLRDCIQKMLNIINNTISETLKTPEPWEFEIGPAVFAGIGDEWSNFQYAIKYRLLPTLQKVLRNYPDTLETVMKKCGLSEVR